MTVADHILNGLDLKDIPSSLLEPRISAWVKTEDHRVEVEFNAAPWFALASSEEILAIRNASTWEEFGSIAKLAARYDPKVVEFFAYNRGFSCEVNDDDVLNWLFIHIKDHVSVAEQIRVHRLINRDTIPEKMSFEELLQAAYAMLDIYTGEEDADLTPVDSAMQYIKRALQKQRAQSVADALILGSRKGKPNNV